MTGKNVKTSFPSCEGFPKYSFVHCAILPTGIFQHVSHTCHDINGQSILWFSAVSLRVGGGFPSIVSHVSSPKLVPGVPWIQW